MLRWAHGNAARWFEVGHGLNLTLRLSGKRRLQADHLPTFLHGNPQSATVLVGINPGFDRAGNAKENAWKAASAGRYTSFHIDFFRSIAEARKQSSSRWWTRSLTALRFLSEHDRWLLEQACANERGRLQPLRSWDAYANSGHVAACDLVPWHSTRDGLTGHLLEAIEPRVARSDEVAHVRNALLDVATAVLHGACGHGAKELVFVSVPAFEIAKRICEDFDQTTLTAGDRKMFLGRGTFDGTPVIAFRRQILVQGPWKDFSRPEFRRLAIGQSEDTGWIAAARRWLDEQGRILRGGEISPEKRPANGSGGRIADGRDQGVAKRCRSWRSISTGSGSSCRRPPPTGGSGG
jgi:hypothetical protein